VTILGFAAGQSRPRLFSLEGLYGPDGDDRITIGAGGATLRLPEELHTGSPREAFCPESTATSRPPG